MLSTMANLASGRDGVGSLPLALTLSADHHTPVNLRHHNHYHNRVNTYDPIRRLALARLPPPASRPTTNKPFTSFCIRDILGGHVDTIEVPSSKPTSTSTSSNGKATSRSRSSGSGLFRARSCSSTSFSPARVQIQAVSVNGARIVRPWAPSPGSPDTEASSDDGIDNFHNNDLDEEEDEEEEISVDDDEPPLRLRARGGKSGVSPLDALMAMTSKTFEGLEAPDAADARRRDQAALFGKHAPPKKRRKSRTAFTNQQIYELEKRFLYQKYLTPADRDEIAHNLGLTNAQVITWFQNRRAKLKRDLEELKNDVTAARKLPVQKGLMGTMAELQLRKIHNEVLKKAAAAEAAEARAIKNRAMDSISPSSSSEATTPPSPQRPQSVSALGGLSPSPSCHSSNSNLSLVDVVWCKTQSSNNKISYSKVNDVADDRVEQNDDIDEEGQSNGCNSRVREGRESREGNSDTCFLACSPKVKLPSPELKVEKKREQTNDSHDMDTTDDAGHSSPHSPDS